MSGYEVEGLKEEEESSGTKRKREKPSVDAGRARSAVLLSQ